MIPSRLCLQLFAVATAVGLAVSAFDELVWFWQGLMALTVSLLTTPYHAVPLVLLAIAALQVVLLIRSVQAHVDALEDFFAAVAYQDFTRRFLQDDLDGELKDAFNRILERFFPNTRA